MADQYDYDEADVEELAAACKRLKTGKLPKDALVKHLKDACHVLERMPQDVQALGAAEQQLPAVLGQKHVLQHTDKDVKMYTAACVAQMLRIWAPDLPFDDRQMQVGPAAAAPTNHLTTLYMPLSFWCHHAAASVRAAVVGGQAAVRPCSAHLRPGSVHAAGPEPGGHEQQLSQPTSSFQLPSQQVHLCHAASRVCEKQQTEGACSRLDTLCPWYIHVHGHTAGGMLLAGDCLHLTCTCSSSSSSSTTSCWSPLQQSTWATPSPSTSLTVADQGLPAAAGPGEP
jgi:hypothetical protein